MPKLKESLDKKQIFLLLFSRELIRNSEEGLFQLKRIIEEGNKLAAEIPVKVPEKAEVKKEDFPLTKSILSEAPKTETELGVVKPVNIKPPRQEISDGVPQFGYPVLRIPEPKLPPEFEYLKPIPSTKEIDLDKLNPFVNDPQVREIECEAPNKPIIVYGGMGKMPTGVMLSNNEIEDTIERFSSASKIPIDVGVYKVVVGNLIFSAIVSDVVPSRFLITKMKPSTQTIIRNPFKFFQGIYDFKQQYNSGSYSFSYNIFNFLCLK
jgi:hypothetical protein